MKKQKAKTPREMARALEQYARLPRIDAEAFHGYGIMALPFASGHILAFRRFPESSFGGYTSVWHRQPDGEWRFYADGQPAFTCARYFGSQLVDALVAEIKVEWTGPASFAVRVPDAGIEWDLEIGTTGGTKLLNTVGRWVPKAMWSSKRALSLLAVVASKLLRAGRIGLAGKTPSGQEFLNNPRSVWVVERSSARVNGEDIGPMGPVNPQAHFEDYWLPQRGILAFGQVVCEALDPSRHELQPKGRGSGASLRPSGAV